MSGLDCLVLLSIIRRQICNSPSPSHSNEDVSGVRTRAANDPSVFTITEKSPNMAFSWMKVPTSAFTFKKTQLRHYAKQALTDDK